MISNEVINKKLSFSMQYVKITLEVYISLGITNYMSGKGISDFIEFLGLEYPKNPRAQVYIGNEDRSYEFLGLFKVNKSPATPLTLGPRIKMWQTMTDIQCLEFLIKYADRFWKDKTENPQIYPNAELAPYQVVMRFVTADEDIFRELKGNELLTKTVITRKNGETKMGIDPVIDKGSVLLSENEIDIKEDIDDWSAFSGKCLDPSYWSISEYEARGGNPQRSKIPVCFHNPSKDSKIEKSIPRVFLAENDAIHVFSDSPLDRKSYVTKFPLVRRLR
jgi:hypothetical protein